MRGVACWYRSNDLTIRVSIVSDPIEGRAGRVGRGCDYERPTTILTERDTRQPPNSNERLVNVDPRGIGSMLCNIETTGKLAFYQLSAQFRVTVDNADMVPGQP